MCGIIGFVGSQKPNLDALKLLGVINDSRGGDSAGYFYNNKIEKGIWAKRTLRGLFEDVVIDDTDTTSFVFIGHTRKSTVGESTVENAHPFLIEDELVLAHNGTLENHWDLCNKYGIDHKDIKVDSKALATLIHQEGFSILNEYRGYAALLMHFKSEPDALYVYRGESRNYTNGALVEERPMYLLERPEGTYFSSMEDALKMIRTTKDQKVGKLIANHVFKFVNGVMIPDASYVVERDNNNIGIKTYTQNFTKATTTTSTTQPTLAIPSIISKSSVGEMKVVGATIKKSDGLNIMDEIMPFDAVILTNERFVKNYKSRYYLCQKGGNKLVNGLIYLDKDGKVYDSARKKVHPFCFAEGILLESEKSMRDFLLDKNTQFYRDGKLDTTGQNFAYLTSAYSKYAVINTEVDAKTIYSELRFKFYHKKKPCHTSIRPLFSKRTYDYKDGILIKVTSTDPNDRIFPNEGKESDAKEAKNILLKADADQKMLLKLADCMDVPFKTRKSFIEDTPDIVVDAIKLQIRDVYKGAIALMQDPNEEMLFVHKKYEEFIDECILHEKGIAENMAGAPQEPIDYLSEAYDIYLEEEQFYDTDSPEDAEFEEINEEDEESSESYQLSLHNIDNEDEKYQKKLAEMYERKFIPEPEFLEGTESLKDINSALLENEDKEPFVMDIEVENNEAYNLTKDLLESELPTLHKMAEKLTMLSNSDYAQDMAKQIYQTIDAINAKAKEADNSEIIGIVEKFKTSGI